MPKFVSKTHTKDSPADHNYANDLENRIEIAVNPLHDDNTSIIQRLIELEKLEAKLTTVEDFASKITFESKFNVRNVIAKRQGRIVTLSFVFDPTADSFVHIGRMSQGYYPTDFMAMATRGHNSSTGSGGVGVYLTSDGTIGLISSTSRATSVTASITYIN